MAQSLQTTIAKQAARTVASKTIRGTAKTVMPTNSLLYKVGVAALIAGVGHFITQAGKPKRFDPPEEIYEADIIPEDDAFDLTDEEVNDILNARMLKGK